jgi:hypothetical protein
MEKIDLKALKVDNNETLEKLFILFLKRLPTLYQENSKTIPFVVAELTLCNHRINKEDARKLLKQFVKQGFLDVVKFRGFKINFSNLSRLLEKKSIVEFANNSGLDVVCSPFFQQIVYTKAKSDAKFFNEGVDQK